MGYSLEELKAHIEDSLSKADAGKSGISEEIIRMEGYSGSKTRHLYNNLCSLPGAAYLEVGAWKGSSFVSAIFGNSAKAVAVDNWSEFFGPKDEFIANVSSLAPGSDWSFVEKDFSKLVSSDFPPSISGFDIYLYDGCHEYECHEASLPAVAEFMSDRFIFVVDDWRGDGTWESVVRGTHDGIARSGVRVESCWIRESRQEAWGSSEYWNGVAIFLCEK